MGDHAFLRGHVCTLAVTVLMLLSLPTWATDLHVDCDAGDNLQAAIDSLDPVGSHTITVLGTCTGRFRINGLNRVTLQGPYSQRATLVSNTPGAGVVLDVINSRMLTLRRLNISGGQIGVRLRVDSEATFEACTVENNTRQGVHVVDHSIGRFGGSEDAAFVSRNNGAQGINVLYSTAYLNGNVTIENNGLGGLGSGFRLESSKASLSADLTWQGPNIIRGNGVYGLQVVRGSDITTWGAVQIENNALGGAAFWMGSSATISGDAEAGFPVIENNPGLGMFVAQSTVYATGPMRIANNGSGSQDPFGIYLQSGAWMTLADADVSNNLGPGIRVEANASLELYGSRITGNAQEGLLVRRLGYAWLTPGIAPMVISGNGGANVACDTTALVAGDVSGITGINCSRIERGAGPPRRGRVAPGGQPSP